jgi:hypothetical protein
MQLPDPFDPNRLAFPSMPNNGKPAANLNGRPSRRTGHDFLKGPIPWSWLAVAARLPGKALAVGLLCWHLAALRGKQPGNAMRWESRLAKSFGLKRQTVYRSLASLERAGLVAVDRHRGRCPNITILKCDARVS